MKPKKKVAKKVARKRVVRQPAAYEHVAALERIADRLEALVAATEADRAAREQPAPEPPA